MPQPIIETHPVRVTAGTIVDPSGEYAKYSKQGLNVASANNMDLGTATGFFIYITGGTSINTLGVCSPGVIRFLVFTGSLTWIHNAVSMILPTVANVSISPGDSAIVISLGSGNWKCIAIVKSNGKPLSISKADVGLSLVENTALSTWPGSTNLTTLGTVNTGIWNATPIASNKGGTGLSSVAQGDLLYGATGNTIVKLAKDTNSKRVICNTGTNNDPAWAQVDLTTAVSGILPSANGGAGRGLQILANPTGTTTTINWAQGNVVIVNLSNATGNISVTLQNPIIGQLCMIQVTQGATARTITFPAGTRQGLQGGATWTPTGANKMDVINLYFDSTTYIIVGTVPDI